MKKPFILKISIAVVLFLVASVYLLTNYDNSENLTGRVINEENEIGNTQKTSLLNIDQKALEDQIFYDINLERSKKSLYSYSKNDKLNRIARDYSEYLLTLQPEDYSHVTPEGKTLEDRLTENNLFFLCSSENLNYFSSLGEIDDIKLISQEVVNGWLKSPGHRALLLNKDSIFSDMGIGTACDDERGCYFTMEVVCLKNSGNIELKEDYLSSLSLYDSALDFEKDVNIEYEIRSTGKINVYIVDEPEDFNRILNDKDIEYIKEYRGQTSINGNLLISKGTTIVFDATPSIDDVVITYKIRYNGFET